MNHDWDIIVKPRSSFFRLDFAEVWRYRDLISILVSRDITTTYKQTVLGPLWMLVQPILTTLIYTFTFGVAAKCPTEGVPAFLFYFMGQVFWLYFADCLNKTAGTFQNNAAIFGKVYFPRMVMPLATISSTFIKFLVQLVLLFIILAYFILQNQVHPNYKYFIFIPFVAIYLGLFGMSVGIILSSLTTKYRDFIFLIGFGVQLLMFASCVTFPLSMFPPKAQFILQLNPVVPMMEFTRIIFTGHGQFSLSFFAIDTLVLLAFAFFAVMVFNRTEKNFMDTV